MATLAEVIVDIRVGIGDDDNTAYTYSDVQITNMISSALRKLSVLLLISYSVVANAFSPSDPGDEIAAIISTQVQCSLAKRDFKKNAQSGVKIKDQDDNMIDTSSGLSSMKDLVGGPHGICEELSKLIAAYKNSVAGSSYDGAENIWSGNSKLYEDVDFDGQGNQRIWRPGLLPGHKKYGSSGGNTDGTMGPDSSSARMMED